MLCCSSSFVPKIMGGNYIIDSTLKSEVKQKIVLNLIICKPVKNSFVNAANLFLEPSDNDTVMWFLGLIFFLI